MKRVAVALVALALAACGGEEHAGSAPVIAGLTLSRPDVRRGVEFFATAAVMDVDGDLRDVEAHFVLTSVEGTTELETKVLPWDVEAGTTQIDVTTGLTLWGDADLGAYELVMTVVDDAGLASVPALIRLDVER